eukprot:5642606-Prymnesium_polylepis.1
MDAFPVDHSLPSVQDRRTFTARLASGNDGMPTASLSIKFVGHGEYAVQMTTCDVGNYTLRIELGD